MATHSSEIGQINEWKVSSYTRSSTDIIATPTTCLGKYFQKFFKGKTKLLPSKSGNCKAAV